MRRIFFLLIAIIFAGNVHVLVTGCGTIMAPTGGPRDSLPPKLLNAVPANGTLNFTGKKITLNFDEYVQLGELQQNLLVSPTPKMTPYIDYKLKSVTIKLRDTLEPNTTYVINLGNAIRDLNEGNIFKNFSYVFSTGSFIDSLEYSGQVTLAETGKIDTTLIVMLYKNTTDSAVQKLKPNYIARLDGAGKFSFHYLSGGTYRVYALQDLNGSRTYNDKKALFAFSSKPVVVNSNTRPDTLYAYTEQKTLEKVPVADKKLKYTTRVPQESQDILSNLTVTFNKPLKNFETEKIILADTLNVTDPLANITIDSSRKKITIKKQWKENETYKLILPKTLSDSGGNTLAKSDTIRFKTRKESDYGSLTINFTNLRGIKNPVLILVGNGETSYYPVTSMQWSRKLFIPGEYEVRLLNDENNNGFWDPGNFATKKQPEKEISISKKISVRGGGWENEVDIDAGK